MAREIHVFLPVLIPQFVDLFWMLLMFLILEHRPTHSKAVPLPVVLHDWDSGRHRKAPHSGEPCQDVECPTSLAFFWQRQAYTKGRLFRKPLIRRIQGLPNSHSKSSLIFPPFVNFKYKSYT